jgi:hypothetical protein
VAIADPLASVVDPVFAARAAWGSWFDSWFEVIGVLEDSGGASSFQGVDLGTTSNEIYVPVSTAIRKFDRPPLAAPLDEIVVRVAADVSPQATAVAIGRLLERVHAGADDFDLVVPEALMEQSRRTQRMFNIVMGCIAGISLLVGGIGIMNIMLATVLERTREIGIRRAVGAKRSEIRIQFMIEAFTISVLRGVDGVDGRDHRAGGGGLGRLGDGDHLRGDLSFDRGVDGGRADLGDLSGGAGCQSGSDRRAQVRVI